MSTETFTPIIDPGTNANTCVQLTMATGTATSALGCRQVLLKCLTQPGYVRFGGSAVTVSATNGYYMAVGDELRIQTSKGATHIAYIRSGGTDGTLSMMPGNAD